MSLLQSPWRHFADDLERQVNIERDQFSVETTLQKLLEAGEFEWIEKVCNEWLAKVARKDLVG